MRSEFAAALMRAACASPTARAPFSVDALVAGRAPAYVTSRDEPRDLPAAFIADLTTEEFQRQQSATASAGARGTRSRRAGTS